MTKPKKLVVALSEEELDRPLWAPAHLAAICGDGRPLHMIGSA